MDRHLYLSKTISEHNEIYNYNSDIYNDLWAEYCIENETVYYNLPPRDYSQDYLTFEAINSGSFSFNIPKDHFDDTLDITSISYSIDNGKTWVDNYRVSSDADTRITTPTITSGNKVLWKGITSVLNVNNRPGLYSSFSSTGRYNIYGNILSLIYGDDFKSYDTLNQSLRNLFYSSYGLISAENLILPTNLGNIALCFNYMFSGCISLTTGPSILPATTLALSCYTNMFDSCWSLVKAPELPATTLSTGCYLAMFNGCTSLTEAPELPATTLANNCYNAMFSGCSNLNYIKALFTTTPSNTYTLNWVYGVASSGTFVKNSTAAWDVTGVNGVPLGWTVQTASV